MIISSKTRASKSHTVIVRFRNFCAFLMVFQSEIGVNNPSTRLLRKIGSHLSQDHSILRDFVPF